MPAPLPALKERVLQAPLATGRGHHCRPSHGGTWQLLAIGVERLNLRRSPLAKVSLNVPLERDHRGWKGLETRVHRGWSPVSAGAVATAT